MGIKTTPTNYEQSITDTKPIIVGESKQADLSDTQPINASKIGLNEESFLAIYRCKKNNRGVRLFWMLVGLFCVLGPLAYTTWSYSNLLKLFGPSPAIQWSYPWMLISCLSLVLYSLFVLWRAFMAANSIKLYEDRMIITQKHFKLDTIPYKNIMGIATDSYQERIFGKPFQNNFIIYLKLSKGQIVRIGRPFCSLQELATQLKFKVYPLVMPFIQADYQVNKWISFGAISMNQSTIQTGNLTIPVEKIAKIELDSGYLTISYHQSDSVKNSTVRKKIPTSKIYNLELFYQLIQSGGS